MLRELRLYPFALPNRPHLTSEGTRRFSSNNLCRSARRGSLLDDQDVVDVFCDLRTRWGARYAGAPEEVYAQPIVTGQMAVQLLMKESTGRTMNSASYGSPFGNNQLTWDQTDIPFGVVSPVFNGTTSRITSNQPVSGTTGVFTVQAFPCARWRGGDEITATHMESEARVAPVHGHHGGSARVPSEGEEGGWGRGRPI